MAGRFRMQDLGWRGRASYLAHAFKAVAKQHHRELIPVLRKFVPAAGVIVDAGSHAGQFAKLFARLAPQGRVYAFEPSSYARSILELAVRARGFGNVTVVGAGLGDAQGTLRLVTPVKRQGTFRYGLAHMKAADAGATGDGFAEEEVPIMTIDSFAAGQGLGRLDFLKVDVEGWERRILEGARESIARWHPAMLLELQEAHLARAGDSLAESWGTLVSWGYKPFLWTGGDELVPLTEPRDGDIFWVAG